MSDKSKLKGLKIAIVGLLCGISVVAVIGISVVLRKGSANEPAVIEPAEEVEQEIVVEEIEPVVIDIGVGDVPAGSSEEQQLQEEPEIPVAPTEAPELMPDTDLTNPDVVPEYVPVEPEPVPEVTPVVEPTVPVDDGSHQGQVYVQGFGWIESGSGSQAVPAPEIGQNGNKIGDM